MKPLTFTGFLKKYLTDLSLTGTCAVRKLEKEVDRNLRLVEPLVLYAKLTMNETQLAKLKNFRLVSALKELSSVSDVEKALENNLLYSDFQKVYNSYLVKKRRIDTEGHTKTLMLSKIKAIQQQKEISNYRIYTDLKMNHGNVNDFLTNGNVSKLSLSSAEKIFDYVMFA